MLELVVALAGAGLFYYLGTRARRPREPGDAPTIPSVHPAPSQGPLSDPFVSRVYAAHQRVNEAPRVATPDDLLVVRPFVDLVELLAEPEAGTEFLLRYFQGDDAVLAWAALVALSRRPADAEAARCLLARLNRFNPWTRHFLLQTLETWRPGDPRLAGDVLVRVDETWQSGENAQVLEAFLRRRAAVAALTLDGLERPQGFDPARLHGVLRGLDPELVRPITDELGPPRRTDVAGTTPGLPWDGAGPALEDLGRVLRPGNGKADDVIPYPSADRRLERVIAALSQSPSRSVLVVGEPGVGKSALVRRAGAALSRQGWTMFEASAAQINAGMSFVGMLEARIQHVRRELAGLLKALWIVPEFQHLLWSGRSTGNPVGILDLILPAVESGEVRVLGEIRTAALERLLLERPDLPRLFEIVRIEPPSAEEMTGLLDAWAAETAASRGATIAPELRAEGRSLAHQYLSVEASPGGVLRLMKRTVQVALRRAAPSATTAAEQDDLVEALVQLTGLPSDILDERRPLDLGAVTRGFEGRVMGQREAVDCLVERLALIKAGVTDPTRPDPMECSCSRAGPAPARPSWPRRSPNTCLARPSAWSAWT